MKAFANLFARKFFWADQRRAIYSRRLRFAVVSRNDWRWGRFESGNVVAQAMGVC